MNGHAPDFAGRVQATAPQLKTAVPVTAAAQQPVYGQQEERTERQRHELPAQNQMPSHARTQAELGGSSVAHSYASPATGVAAQVASNATTRGLSGAILLPEEEIISLEEPTPLDFRISASLEAELRRRNLSLSESAKHVREQILHQIDTIVKTWVTNVYLHLQDDGAIGARRSPDEPERFDISRGARICTFGSYRMGVSSSESDIDVVCLVPKFVDRYANVFGLPVSHSTLIAPSPRIPGASDSVNGATSGGTFGAPSAALPGSSLYAPVAPAPVSKVKAPTPRFCTLLHILEDLPSTSNIVAVPEAFVPVIKFHISGVEIDLLVACLDRDFIPKELDVLDDSVLLNVDDVTARSINGVRVTDTIMRLVPNQDTFRAVLRAVKHWATVRCIYSNALGFLGGVGWAIMVAKICLLFPHASPNTLLEQFFRVYSSWSWPSPVTLCSSSSQPRAGLHFSVWNPVLNRSDRKHLMPVITPAYPALNSSYNVCSTTFRIMTEEFARACAVFEPVLSANAAAATTTGTRQNTRGATEKHGTRQEVLAGEWTSLEDPLACSVKAWGELFCRSDVLHRYPSFLIIDAFSEVPEQQRRWCAFVEAKLRYLILRLETLARTLVRPIPVVFCQNPLYKPYCANTFLFGLSFSISPGVLDYNVDLVTPIQEWSAQILSWIERASDMMLSIVHVPGHDLPEFVLREFYSAHKGNGGTDVGQPPTPSRSDSRGGPIGDGCSAHLMHAKALAELQHQVGMGMASGSSEQPTKLVMQSSKHQQAQIQDEGRARVMGQGQVQAHLQTQAGQGRIQNQPVKAKTQADPQQLQLQPSPPPSQHQQGVSTLSANAPVWPDTKSRGAATGTVSLPGSPISKTFQTEFSRRPYSKDSSSVHPSNSQPPSLKLSALQEASQQPASGKTPVWAGPTQHQVQAAGSGVGFRKKDRGNNSSGKGKSQTPTTASQSAPSTLAASGHSGSSLPSSTWTRPHGDSSGVTLEPLLLERGAPSPRSKSAGRRATKSAQLSPLSSPKREKLHVSHSLVDVNAGQSGELLVLEMELPASLPSSAPTRGAQNVAVWSHREGLDRVREPFGTAYRNAALGNVNAGTNHGFGPTSGSIVGGSSGITIGGSSGGASRVNASKGVSGASALNQIQSAQAPTVGSGNGAKGKRANSFSHEAGGPAPTLWKDMVVNGLPRTAGSKK